MTDGTYIGFMVLTFLGAALAWALVDAQKVIRKDGSHVILMKHPSWRSEFLGLYETFRTDPWVVLLFPMFFASNWFYPYQFNCVNAAKFNIRTRALNNILYWTSQIIGAYVFGYILDLKNVRRSMRAKGLWVILFIMTMAIWGGGYAWQKKYTRAQTSADDFVSMDWVDNGYVGPMFLFMFYGFFDGKSIRCYPDGVLGANVCRCSRMADQRLLVRAVPPYHPRPCADNPSQDYRSIDEQRS